MQPSSPSRRSINSSAAPVSPRVGRRDTRARHVVVGGEYSSSGASRYDEEEENVAARAPRVRRTLTRALSRVRRARCGPWEWLGIVVSLLVCLLLVREMASAQSGYRMMRHSVQRKEDQLAAMDQQKRKQERRLAFLRSSKGREQLLIERGYHQPGARILLFPVEKPKPDASR